jgi:hypothetical protein
MKTTKKLLFVEIPQKVGSTWREATKEEIEESEKLRKKISAIRSQIEELSKKEKLLVKSCKHYVRYDIRGYEYDIRCCYACEGNLGLI